MREITVAAVGVLAIALTSCTSEPSESPEEFGAVLEMRSRAQEVMDARVGAKQAALALFELEDPYGPEGLEAVDRVREAWGAAEAAVRQAEADLPPGLEDEWALVSEDTRVAASNWDVALTQVEALITKMKPMSAAGELLAAAESAESAADESLSQALRELDRLVCEGTGDEWDAEAAECVGAGSFG